MISPIPFDLDKNLRRGPSPVTAADWSVLIQIGIKFTLDLQTGSAFLLDGSPMREQVVAESCGIRAYCHPLGEILPPTFDELNLALNFLRGHESVYVHCKAGVDRTGMVVAYYRRHAENWTRRAAIQEMFDRGMHPWYRLTWAWFLR